MEQVGKRNQLVRKEKEYLNLEQLMDDGFDLSMSIKEQDTVKTTRIVKSYGGYEKRSVLAILEELTDVAALVG
ncbi:MAG: hypothetical protein CSA50_02210 [Gammaproteobacteria bacterium]|nr:MAG: hypothetical protein CSA50_02210 [Gammaproteobacteria bacterium]